MRWAREAAEGRASGSSSQLWSSTAQRASRVGCARQAASMRGLCRRKTTSSRSSAISGACLPPSSSSKGNRWARAVIAVCICRWGWRGSVTGKGHNGPAESELIRKGARNRGGGGGRVETGRCVCAANTFPENERERVHVDVQIGLHRAAHVPAHQLRRHVHTRPHLQTASCCLITCSTGSPSRFHKTDDESELKKWNLLCT